MPPKYAAEEARELAIFSPITLLLKPAYAKGILGKLGNNQTIYVPWKQISPIENNSL